MPIKGLILIFAVAIVVAIVECETVCDMFGIRFDEEQEDDNVIDDIIKDFKEEEE